LFYTGTLHCVTHKWHAKRFHMGVIDGNWTVPLTANEKNFRVTYRAAAKTAYVEDLSYWQCIEASNTYESCEDTTKINMSGVIYDTIKEGLRNCNGSSFGWLEGRNHQTIAMVFCVKISEEITQWRRQRSAY